ncbi:NAD(P)H-dependent oxidoreductase [Halorarum halophilum]|uniref:NAD(P)H-dependent oxidoreductase n=1 Tax=Halorarum halophilum TaxID=2743090 RepID=A0A7D5GCU3_9EURY|nr:NAD(P)H-dependent oxidoreductase [Halobaculum halophilum]QLG28486.1 NAD(P)H-dependent oxidoreductase [Halobaculum halophilum]
MTEAPRVVAVCGSRREGSYTRAALHYALDAAGEAGAETDYIDLGDPALDVPLYHPDVDPKDAGDVAELLERMRAADGALIGTPVYHGSYSSTFRSFHDWCSFDEYEDTVVGLFAVAGGGSYEATLEHMRATIRGVHGWTAPLQVGLRNARNRFERRDGPGEGIGAESNFEFVDEGLRERTLKLGRRVAHYAGNKDEFLDVV